jgi:hypothetical protein
LEEEEKGFAKSAGGLTARVKARANRERGGKRTSALLKRKDLCFLPGLHANTFLLEIGEDFIQLIFFSLQLELHFALFLGNSGTPNIGNHIEVPTDQIE